MVMRVLVFAQKNGCGTTLLNTETLSEKKKKKRKKIYLFSVFRRMEIKAIVYF